MKQTVEISDPGQLSNGNPVETKNKLNCKTRYILIFYCHMAKCVQFTIQACYGNYDDLFLKPAQNKLRVWEPDCLVLLTNRNEQR